MYGSTVVTKREDEATAGATAAAPAVAEPEVTAVAEAAVAAAVTRSDIAKTAQRTAVGLLTVLQNAPLPP